MKTVIVIILVSIIALSHVTLARGETRYRKFDELYGMNWEDTMARLDNYAIQLQNEPSTFGVVVVHGKQHGRRGQFLDWASCIHDYLINRRGISSSRIVLTEAQPWEAITVELWLSVEKGLPDPDLKVLKPRKGKAKTWRRLCNI